MGTGACERLELLVSRMSGDAALQERVRALRVTDLSKRSRGDEVGRRGALPLGELPQDADGHLPVALMGGEQRQSYVRPGVAGKCADLGLERLRRLRGPTGALEELGLEAVHPGDHRNAEGAALRD